MNIGIDGYEINSERLVGIGMWGFEIIKKLYEIDNQNTYTIFLPSPPKNLPPKRPNWQYRIVPRSRLWTFTSLPYAIWTSKNLDIFLSPTHYIPRFVSIPKIVSVMDLSYLHYPELFLPKDLYKLKNWTQFSVKIAKKVITISNFTKSEIVKYYKIPSEKIVVVYPGVNEIYNREVKSTPSNSTSEYLLFVGTIQPRKNIKRLIVAFNEYIKEDNNGILKLLIVGKKGWLYESIFELVKEKGLEKRVEFLDYVKDEDMPMLYKKAKAFILPSLYEGFGIPVIEALKSGVPTVLSNTSSLPEVGGEAVIYIDPESIDSIKIGIKKILSLNKNEKEIMIQKGYKQAEKFSWQKSAQIVLKTIKDIK